MPHPLRKHRFIEDEIELAVEPYVGLVDSDELEWIREQLAYILECDPEARALLEQSYPSEVEKSGLRAKVGEWKRVVGE